MPEQTLPLSAEQQIVNYKSPMVWPAFGFYGVEHNDKIWRVTSVARAECDDITALEIDHLSFYVSDLLGVRMLSDVSSSSRSYIFAA